MNPPNKKEALEKYLADFDEFCRGEGIKVTHQRREVYREVVQTTEHPDVETVYGRVRQRIPTISLDTVYRILRLFEARNLVFRTGEPGKRARFDANPKPHHHFFCVKCGALLDIYNEEFNQIRVPQDLDNVGRIENVQVEMRGTCARCCNEKITVE